MDKFDVLRMIGEGGYGVVYKCKSKDTGDVVAVKKIKHSINGDPRKVGLREIRILTVLKHPNINQLLGAFKSKDRLYLVLECVEKTLLDVLNENPTGIACHKFRSYTYQLACALQYCHGKGVVHRDVKPENLLITEKDVLKLCDFGFARFLPSVQNASIASDEDGELPSLPTGFHQLTVYVATRWYRPPELILRLPYGKPVDVWTIGCILVEMATGEPLFSGDTDIDQLHQITSSVGPFTSDQMDAMLASPKYQFITANSQSDGGGGAGKMTVSKKDSLQRFQGILGDEIFDILIRCINNDPNQRITAEACANHPALELERRTIIPQMSSYGKLSQMLNPKPSAASNRNKRWDWSKMVLELPESPPGVASPRSGNNLLTKEEEMLMDAEVDLEKERENEEGTALQMVKNQRDFALKHLSSLVNHHDVSFGNITLSYAQPPSSSSQQKHRSTDSTVSSSSSSSSSSLPKIPQNVLPPGLASPPYMMQRSLTNWFQPPPHHHTLPASSSHSTSDDRGNNSKMSTTQGTVTKSTSGSELLLLGDATGPVKRTHARTITTTAAAVITNNSSSSDLLSRASTNLNVVAPQTSQKSQLNVYVVSKTSDVVKWDTLIRQHQQNSSTTTTTSTTATGGNNFSTTTLRSLKHLNTNLKPRQSNNNNNNNVNSNNSELVRTVGKSDLHLPEHLK